MKLKTFKTIVFGIGATLLLCSCQKEFRYMQAGDSISFTAGSGFSQTKAAYSGVTNSAGTIERIDWQSGDLMRIYCAQASEPSVHYADYIVKSVDTPTSGSVVSTAHIETFSDATDGIGLRWGEGDHTFYAAFPSPATTGGITTSISGNEVSANLSGSQTPASVTTSGVNYTAVADLKNMLMTAKAGPYTAETMPDESTVFLAFTPLTTAVKFTITNQSKADLTVKSVSLISASSALNGPFTVDIDDESHQPESVNLGSTTVTYSQTYPYCQYTGTVSDATKKVTINFATPITLAYDANIANCGSLTFTFFLQPSQNFDDLTFKLVKSDDSWMSTRLGYTDGTGIFFPRFKKTAVNGVFVPEGAQWTVKYDPTVQSWNQSSSDINPMPETDGDPFVTSWDTGIDDELTLTPELVKWIDLGLPSGKLWADRNVGADASYEVGNYYSWGETELWYTSISGNTVTMKPEYNQFNWTVYSSQSNMKSILSNLTGTYAIYDVARLLYGSDCHIPLDNEYRELADNCYWRYVSSYDGQSVEGYMIFKAKADADKGKYTLENPIYTPVANYNESDTHIFLPYSGFITAKTVRSGNIDSGPAGKNVGYYLTSTTGQVALTSTHAGEAGYERFAVGTSSPSLATVPRHAAMPVRAVKQKQKTIEYVEIGGLKWATMNLGATTPEEPGLYFAWGDVAGQYAATTGTGAFTKSFVWANTPFNNGKTTAQNTWFSNNQSLWITDDATLKPDYDAANVLIGGGWRMPTQEDLANLLSNTNQVPVADYNGTGVAGWICTSKTDDTKAIFLPATGYGSGTGLASSGWGCYWSSTLTVSNKGNAERITLGETVSGNNSRLQGRCIRPVHD